MSQANHIPRIDVLRAIAILLVFSSHFAALVYGSPGYRWNGIWYQWMDSPSLITKVFRLTIFDGGLGVCLFFVISGLCIRLSHLAVSRFSIPYFYWRRFWRIYPSYFVALVLFVLLQRYGNTRDILQHAFLVHNLSPQYFYSINGPFWSLALEVQVYLLYPLLLVLHNRLGPILTSALLALLSAVSSALGGETVRHLFHLPDSFEAARQLPTLLWFTWYAGFLVADVFVANLAPTIVTRIVLVSAILLLPLVRLCRPLVSLEQPLIGIILALAVWEYLKSRSHFSMPARYIALLGICSYSFYLYFDQLINPTFTQVVRFSRISSPALFFVIGYPLTILVIFAFSYLAYLTIERGSVAIGQLLHRPLAVRQGARR